MPPTDRPDQITVVLDGTPLLGRQTGVGTYVRHLLEHLTRDPSLRLRVAPVTVRSPGPPELPPGVVWRHRPGPARLLRGLWTHVDVPPVELLTGRCDVYHGTNFVLPPRARAGGVVTVHDLSYLHHRGTVDRTSLAYRELVPRGIRHAAVVLTPSHAVAAEVRAEYGLPPERVLATPLGVDAAWARAAPLDPATRTRLGIPGRYLLFVGTQEPRKELGLLVRAHRAARREDPEGVPPLVLVGQRGWGAEQDLEGTVRPGYVDDATLRGLTAGATALVMPSRYEGFGLPVLEALACGVAVICSDIPVLREVAGDQATYTPVGDVDELAAALLRLGAGDDPATAAGSPPARRRRASTFTWARCADLTAAAYHRAAGR